MTILLSCHVIEFLEGFIDRCVLLKDGRAIKEAEVKGRTSLRELYIGQIDQDSLALPF
jgi:ABC-type multidrug transport system ATPase subunit